MSFFIGGFVGTTFHYLIFNKYGQSRRKRRATIPGASDFRAKATLVPCKNGKFKYECIVEVDTVEKGTKERAVLSTAKYVEKLFENLDAVAKFLQERGIKTFRVLL